MGGTATSRAKMAGELPLVGLSCSVTVCILPSGLSIRQSNRAGALEYFIIPLPCLNEEPLNFGAAFVSDTIKIKTSNAASNGALHWHVFNICFFGLRLELIAGDQPPAFLFNNICHLHEKQNTYSKETYFCNLGGFAALLKAPSWLQPQNCLAQLAGTASLPGKIAAIHIKQRRGSPAYCRILHSLILVCTG